MNMCITHYQMEYKERPVIRRAKAAPKCWRRTNRRTVKRDRLVW